MDTNIQLSRPEQKHGEADAIRLTDLNSNITELPIYCTIVTAINDCKGYNDTAPINLFGVSTLEYCIVSCPNSDPNVARVIQYLRGQGFCVELFRLSESWENPTKYRQAVLICWDPKVIQSSLSPKYYSSREGMRIPCSQCSKQRSGEVVSCEGCATARLWLAGVAGLKNYGHPCSKCSRNNSAREDEPQCEGCPVKFLWLRTCGSETPTAEPANPNTGATES